MDKWTIVGYAVGIIFNISFVAVMRAKLYDSTVEFLKSGRFAWFIVFLLSAIEMAITGGMEALKKPDAFMALLQAAAAYATTTQAAYAAGKPVWTAAVKSGNAVKCLILVLIAVMMTVLPTTAHADMTTVYQAQIGMTQVSLASVESVGQIELNIIQPIAQIDTSDGGIIENVQDFIDKFGGKIIYLQSFKTKESCAAGDLSFKVYQPQKLPTFTFNADVIARFDDGIKLNPGASININQGNAVVQFGVAYVPDERYRTSWFIKLVEVIK
ncbi:MAG: hypothetical protein WC455_11995 [Dehalococcoidia bacterium]|jgi:hypothetical protein